MLSRCGHSFTFNLPQDAAQKSQASAVSMIFVKDRIIFNIHDHLKFIIYKRRTMQSGLSGMLFMFLLKYLYTWNTIPYSSRIHGLCPTKSCSETIQSCHTLGIQNLTLPCMVFEAFLQNILSSTIPEIMSSDLYVGQAEGKCYC